MMFLLFVPIPLIHLILVDAFSVRICMGWANRGVPPKVHFVDTALPYWACTPSQLRPEQPFCSSYLDVLGMYVNSNCLTLMVISGRETCTTIQRGVFTWPSAGRGPALLGTLFWEGSVHLVMQLEDYWGGVTPDQIGLPTTDPFYLPEQRHFPPWLGLFLQNPVDKLKLLGLKHFKGGNITVCLHIKQEV